MLEPAAFPRDRQCPTGTAAPHPLRWHPCPARGEPSRCPPALPDLPARCCPRSHELPVLCPVVPGPRGRARCRQGSRGREEGHSLWRPDKRLFIFLPTLPAARPPRWGEEAPDNKWAQGSATGGLCCDPRRHSRATPTVRRRSGTPRWARLGTALYWVLRAKLSSDLEHHTL